MTTNPKDGDTVPHTVRFMAREGEAAHESKKLHWMAVFQFFIPLSKQDFTLIESSP
jgi:hypothetical protein